MACSCRVLGRASRDQRPSPECRRGKRQDPGGSAQAADRPRGNEIKLAPGNPLEHRIVSRATISPRHTTDALIGEHADDYPAETDGDLVQLSKLVLDRLVLVRARPGIEGCALRHPSTVSWI